MPFFNVLFRELRDKIVDATITVYYHKGNPGAAGTANRLSAADVQTPAPTIAAGSSGWTLDSTLGRATRTSAVSFGNALRNVNGITHYSLVKGGNVIGTEELAESFNAVQGLPVVLRGATLILNVTM